MAAASEGRNRRAVVEDDQTSGSSCGPVRPTNTRCLVAGPIPSSRVGWAGLGIQCHANASRGLSRTLESYGWS